MIPIVSRNVPFSIIQNSRFKCEQWYKWLWCTKQYNLTCMQHKLSSRVKNGWENVFRRR